MHSMPPPGAAIPAQNKQKNKQIGGIFVSNQIEFSYGILSGTLEEQANKQGYTLGEEAEKLEKIRKAINMCKFHVATDSQVSSMIKKLHDKVIKALKPLDN